MRKMYVWRDITYSYDQLQWTVGESYCILENYYLQLTVVCCVFELK